MLWGLTTRELGEPHAQGVPCGFVGVTVLRQFILWAKAGWPETDWPTITGDSCRNFLVKSLPQSLAESLVEFWSNSRQISVAHGLGVPRLVENWL
jgi:hypothetical protein